MSINLKDVLRTMEKRAELHKEAFEPPAPPMDPAMAGGAPMDPAMAGGAPPPMDPSMGGAPPMDPAMAGGAPPPQMDPAMLQQMQQALMDPNVQAMLEQIGIQVDPQRGPIDMETGQVIPPDQMLQILQELMAQMPPPGAAPGGAPMDPAMAGGAPPMDPAMAPAPPPPMAPPMPKAAEDMTGGGMPVAPAAPMDAPPMPQEQGGDIEARLTALEEQVGEMAAKLEANPDTTQSVVEEGMSPEAQQVLGPDSVQEEGDQQIKTAVEEPVVEKTVTEKPMQKKASTRKEDPARRLSKLISRIRGE